MGLLFKYSIYNLNLQIITNYLISSSGEPFKFQVSNKTQIYYSNI